MTIRQAIGMADELEPNQIDYDVKIGWLSDLDQQIYTEIMMTHEGLSSASVMPEYDYDTDVDTDLLVPDVYGANMYSEYLRMKINEAVNDEGRLSIAKSMFDVAYRKYSDWYNRNHMPKNKGTWRF